MNDTKKIECFECSGYYVETIITYETEKDGKTYLVEDIPLLRCVKCGDTCFSSEACRLIEKGLMSQGFKFRKRKFLTSPEDSL